MKTLPILCDLDGIIADCCGHWLNRLRQKFGVTATMDDVTDWDIAKAEPLKGLRRKDVYDVLHEPDFFATLPPLDGAVSSVTYLHDVGHNVGILTATPERSDYQAQWNKLDWLRMHFPWIKPSDVHFASAQTKHTYTANVFIDDRPDTLERIRKAHGFDVLVTGIEYRYNNHLSPDLGVKLAKDYRDTRAAWAQMLKWIEEHAQ